MDIDNVRAKIYTDLDLISDLIYTTTQELHGFKLPPGTGKTYLSSKLARNWYHSYPIVMLAPRHDIASDWDRNYDIHLWGRNHFDCPRKDQFEATKNLNINRKRIICHGCTFDCEYKKQFALAKKSKRVITVHSYLKTDLINDIFDGYKRGVLIIDESPLQSLVYTTNITRSDLLKMDAIIDYPLFHDIAMNLIKIINSRHSYYGLNFIKAYNYSDIFKYWNVWSKRIDDWNMSREDKSECVSNHISILKDIDNYCGKYDDDVCLPFAKPLKYIQSKNRAVPINYIAYTDISSSIPPDIRVMLLDATADVRLLRMFFPNFKFVEHKYDIKNVRKPFQIIDATYGRSGVSHKWTTKRIANAIYQQSKWIPKDETIGVITFKMIEKEIYKMLVEMHLQCKVKTEHYNNLTGTNDFNKCTTLFVVGSPEVPSDDMRLIAEALHVGNAPISTVRLKDNTYKDKRLQQVVAHWRESELVQAIGRARMLTNSNIQVFIITNLKIPIDTIKIDMKVMAWIPTSPIDVALVKLHDMYRLELGNYVNLYNALRRMSPYRNAKSPGNEVTKWIKKLKYKGYIEKHYSRIKITKDGLEMIKYIGYQHDLTAPYYTK